MLSSVANSRPAHVADHAVYEFDMVRDPGLLADPHARVHELLRDAPEMFWTPHNGGHWIIMGYDANFEAARDPETFSSNSPEMLASPGQRGSASINGRRVPDPFPICLDGPMHRKYRAPLQQFFAPRAVLALRESVQLLAKEIIGKVAARGYCDGIHDIAEPLHVTAFLRLFGLPVDQLPRFRQIIKEFTAPYNERLEIIERLWKVMDAMRDSLIARRATPGNDLISELWRCKIDDEPMTIEDLENYGVILFTAGLDTAVNVMGFGIHHLAIDGPLQEELRADTRKVAHASEELLRRYSVSSPLRLVRRDTKFRGHPMKRGERVVLYLPAANLDRRVFPEAQTGHTGSFHEQRSHISFGAGPHRCVGSHLARIELQTLYETLLTYLPSFRIDPDQAVRFRAGHVIGIDALPLRWNPTGQPISLGK